MSATHKTSWIALLIALVSVPLAVGTVPFGPQLSLSPFSAPAVVVLGLAGGVAAIAWALSVFRGEIAFRHHRLLLALGAFTLLAAVSTVSSLDRGYAFFGDGDDLNGLAVYVLCALLVPVTIGLCSSSSKMRTLTGAVIASGVVVAAIALVQQLFGLDIFSEVAAEQTAELGWMISQGSSTLGNPDFTGTFLVLPTVLAISRAFSSDLRDARSIARDITPAILMAAALVLTLTRGAWLGLAAGTGVIVAIAITRGGGFSPQLRRIAIAAAITLAAVLAFGGTEILRRFRELAEGGLAGFSGRSIIWSETLRMIAERPLLGTGPATFRLGWYPAREISGLMVSADAFATDAHNYPLMLAATIGIPAALALLYLWVRALAASSGLVWGREARSSADYRGWWAASLALAVALLTGVATTPVLLLLFVSLGVLLAPLSEPRSPSPAEKTALTSAVAVLAAGCLLVTGLQGYAHVAARSALLDSPQALSRVAGNVPWNGHIGLLAAQLNANATQQAALVGESARTAFADIFSAPSERHPNDPEFPASWGLQLFIAGDAQRDPILIAEGLDISDRAVALYPNSLRLRTDRARALIVLGRPDDALAELERFRELAPEAPEAELVRSLIDAAEAASAETTPTP